MTLLVYSKGTWVSWSISLHAIVISTIFLFLEWLRSGIRCVDTPSPLPFLTQLPSIVTTYFIYASLRLYGVFHPSLLIMCPFFQRPFLTICARCLGTRHGYRLSSFDSLSTFPSVGTKSIPQTSLNKHFPTGSLSWPWKTTWWFCPWELWWCSLWSWCLSRFGALVASYTHYGPWAVQTQGEPIYSFSMSPVDADILVIATPPGMSPPCYITGSP